MIIEQILVTGMAVFCYLLVDEETREALLIDPAGDYKKIDSKIEKHNAKIKMIVNTHGHYDHTSGNDYYVKKTGGELLIHESDKNDLGRSSPKADRFLKNNDTIKLGKTSLKVIHTPGHSQWSICLYGYGNIFTGDTLFTEGMGRTDLPGGSYGKIMDSIQNKILSLPDNTIIWPGHHYGRKQRSTVQEQKRIYS